MLKNGEEGHGIPYSLNEWIRDHAPLGSGMSTACWEATAAPPDDEDSAAMRRYGRGQECLDCGFADEYHPTKYCAEPRFRPKSHADCTGDNELAHRPECTCMCHLGGLHDD